MNKWSASTPGHPRGRHRRSSIGPGPTPPGSRSDLQPPSTSSQPDSWIAEYFRSWSAVRQRWPRIGEMPLRNAGISGTSRELIRFLEGDRRRSRVVIHLGDAMEAP